MKRSAVIVAALLALGIVLTGCVSIPTHSAVLPGSPLTQGSADSAAEFRPDGPAKGASQEDILQGFITAATGPDQNFKVAREYLSTSISQKWNPNSRVLVSNTRGVADTLDATSMTYSLRVSASVDAVGHYTTSDGGTQQVLRFSFTKENGQWRISSAPDGIVLSDVTFLSIFEPQTLYFFDPSYQYLVPDVRWFPSRYLAAARIVQALLAGPSSWLSGAVTTAFPQGTQLLSTSIPVESGVATVDLSSDVLGESELAKQRMRTQLEDSFGNLPNVQSVAITGDSVPIRISASSQSGVDPNVLVDSRPLVFSGGKFGFASGTTIVPLSVSTRVEKLSPIGATLSRAGTSAAVLTTAGVYLVKADAEPVLLDKRTGLVTPSIDPTGYVWSAQSASAHSLEAIDSSGSVHPIASSLPADASIVSLAVSRDGSRLLIYLQGSAGPQLIVAGVIRQPQSLLPTGLGDLLYLPVTGDSPIDATWVDSTSVAYLSGSGSAVIAMIDQIGGLSKGFGSPANGAVIVGGNSGTDGLHVLTSTGALLQPQSFSSWQATGVTATFIATQQ